MSFLHRHRWAAPFALLAPGVLWLAIFFVLPFGYLAYQSLQSGIYPSFEFTWEFSNFSEAISDNKEQLIRSFGYAGLATVIAFLFSYPLAYWIAFRAGRWKNVFLVLVIAPFFVTYLIRTIAWQTILSDDGFVLDVLKGIGVVADDGRLARDLDGRRGGHHLQLPPLHDPPDLRVARAGRPADARGGGGSLREPTAGLPARHVADVAAGGVRRGRS